MLQKIMTATEQTTAKGGNMQHSAHSLSLLTITNAHKMLKLPSSLPSSSSSSLSTPRRPLDRPGPTPARCDPTARGSRSRSRSLSQRQPTFCLHTAMNDSTSCSGRLRLLRAWLLCHSTTAANQTTQAQQQNQTKTTGGLSFLEYPVK